jgi:thioredoxin reductase (NADPH)
VFLAAHASKVVMLVRGRGLADTMSSYLVERIASTGNVELRTRTELCALHGEPGQGLAAVSWRDNARGTHERRPIRHVFLFIGADPETDWLAGCGVALDKQGFVLTGRACTAGTGVAPAALESTIPGVFAVGDARAGSVKRVGAAIGEGAAVVPLIHQTLAARALASAGSQPATAVAGEASRTARHA